MSQEIHVDTGDDTHIQSRIQLADDLLIPIPRRPTILVPLSTLHSHSSHPFPQVWIVCKRGAKKLEQMALYSARCCQRLLRLDNRQVFERQCGVPRVAPSQVLGNRRCGRTRLCGRRARRGRDRGDSRLEDCGVVEVAFSGHDRVCARGCETLFDIAIEQNVAVRDHRNGYCLLDCAYLLPICDTLVSYRR